MTRDRTTTIDETVVHAAVAETCEFVARADPSVKRDLYGITNRIDDVHRSLAGSILGGLTRFVRAARDDLVAREGAGAWLTFRGVECRVTPSEANLDVLDVRIPEDRTYRLECTDRGDGPDLPYGQVMLYGYREDGRPVLLATTSLRDMPSLRAAGLASLVISDSSLVAEDATIVLDLADAVRPALRDDLRIEFGPMPRNSGLEALTGADGGLPGDHWRAALGRLDDALASATLRWAASRIDDVVGLATELGIVLGQAYLAYDDTDKRVFAIPGRKAFLYEDLDLTTSWSAFAFDVDDGVATAYVLDRDECDFAGFLASYPSGTVAKGVVSFRMDLATGTVERSSDLPVGDAMDNLRHGTLSVSRVLARLREDELDLGGTDEIRHDFSPYEKNHDLLHDEAPVGPTP